MTKSAVISRSDDRSGVSTLARPKAALYRINVLIVANATLTRGRSGLAEGSTLCQKASGLGRYP